MIRSWLLPVLALLPAIGGVRAAESLPSRPADYVTDRAGILSPATISEWNTRLATYERETSNQVVTAIFPTVPNGDDMEDFTSRTAEAWKVGQKDKSNGVVLFIFVNDHKMRIEVGYGLEGAIPDATAKAIVVNEIRPAFRTGDYDGGISKGLEAILAAARGEYHGTGQTDADASDSFPVGAAGFLIFIIGFVIFGFFANQARQGRSYRGRGSQTFWGVPMGGGSSGGWSSSSGGDSGGFSGGGGSFGGGGASGGW